MNLLNAVRTSTLFLNFIIDTCCQTAGKIILKTITEMHVDGLVTSAVTVRFAQTRNFLSANSKIRRFTCTRQSSWAGVCKIPLCHWRAHSWLCLVSRAVYARVCSTTSRLPIRESGRTEYTTHSLPFLWYFYDRNTIEIIL